MSPSRRSATAVGTQGRTAGSVIAIPVPTTPAVVPVPPHERAWDVSGAWPAWARYAARQIPGSVVTVIFVGLGGLVAAATPLADTWPLFAMAGIGALVASLRPQRVMRTRRALLRHKWTAYQAAVSRTESVAWLNLQQSRTRANAHVVASMRVVGGRRVREEVASPAYENVWFCGDVRRGGIVVPAGGGPLVYVTTYAGATAPARADRVSTGVLPAGAVRPTLTQWVLRKVLSETTRRNMAARKADRELRRQQKLKALAARRAAAANERQRKQAEWDRAHPEKVRRRQARVQAETARRKAARDRDAARYQAMRQRQQAKAAKPTVVTALRARRQAKEMRDNFGKRG